MVGGLDVTANGFLPFSCGVMHAHGESVFGQGGEPAVHQIQPGGAVGAHQLPTSDGASDLRATRKRQAR